MFSRLFCSTRRAAVIPALAALLVLTNAASYAAQGQPSEASRKQFLEFKARAEKGEAAAQNGLGFFYWRGHGVEQDLTQAAKWFRKAAEQNHPEAQSNLGVCYRDGHGVPKDFVEAVKWHRKAAEQDYASAQGNLGVSYSNGQGVAKDIVEAYAWLSLAARSDAHSAQNRDALAKTMTPEQIFEGTKRSRELRVKLGTKSKSLGN